MVSFLDEEVPPVNPLGTQAIEELGRCFLGELAPEVLTEPCALDVLGLVDERLPDFGIHVCPASREEIGNRDGATDPQSGHEVTILVSEEVWNSLELPVPGSHYARATVCHEIGHAVLHVPVLRRKLQVTEVLARTQRRKLRAFEDPEWQAWMFAGAILMPSVTLRSLMSTHGQLRPGLVSETYAVSTKMAASHLRRLKWVTSA